MQFAGISDTGKVRENNEDSYCLGELPRGADGAIRVLLAVADGLGGYSAGEVASAMAIRTLRAHVATGGGSWPDLLRQGIAAAHEAIVFRGREGSLRGMGTTLTAAVVDGGRVHWGHVGDSRAYLVRADSMRLLTRDHSIAAELLAAGRIGREAARHHPHRHVLTQALGAEEDPSVETGEAVLGDGDWLVLATDGLTAIVTDEEIGDAVRSSADPGACCQRLVVLANARGGPDNITVVVLRAG